MKHLFIGSRVGQKLHLEQSFRTPGRPYIFSAPATHFPETTPQYGYGFPKPGCYWIQNYMMKNHSDHFFILKLKTEICHCARVQSRILNFDCPFPRNPNI